MYQGVWYMVLRCVVQSAVLRCVVQGTVLRCVVHGIEVCGT